MKNFLGDKIYAQNASWSFDKKVPKNFTKHVSKSVPFYLEGHEIICAISDFFLIGAHDLTGVIYNLGGETPVKNAIININGWKFGPGLGGSIGAAFVLAHGYGSPGKMNGVTGGWDFDLALAAKLGDFLKASKAWVKL